MLMAVPLVLPIGTVTQANESVQLNISTEIQLKSLTAEIVSVQAKNLELPTIKKPEPRKTVPQPVSYVNTRNYQSDPGPAGKRALAKRVAAAYGIDWKILEAVWQVESGKSWHRVVYSYAGASGPCQFMPGTWRAYAVDGNKDGYADVNYAPDCLYGAAKLLAANGLAEGKVTQALLRYNNSMSYVNHVLSIARTY